MSYTDFSNDDTLDAILSELKNAKPEKVEKHEVSFNNSDTLTLDNLESFILNNGAKTVSLTQDIVQILLDQVQSTPDPELITSVAEMVGSNNKALETLTKLYLNKQKENHAIKMEMVKAEAKQKALSVEANKKPITREEVMALIYNDDETKLNV